MLVIITYLVPPLHLNTLSVHDSCLTGSPHLHHAIYHFSSHVLHVQLLFLGTKIVYLVNIRVIKVGYQTSSYHERILWTYRGSAMPETETYQIAI